MVKDIFNTPLARELSELLYTKLKDSQNRELKFEEILDFFNIKVEYGLSKVNGEVIHLIREKNEVE